MIPEIYLSVKPFGADGLDRAMKIARDVGCAGLEIPAPFLSDIKGPEYFGDLPVRVVGINCMNWRPGQPLNIAETLILAKHYNATTVNIYGGLTKGDDPSTVRYGFVKAVSSAIDETPDDSPVITLENELADVPGFSASFDAWLGLIRGVDSPRFRGTLDAANFMSAGEDEAIGRIVDEAIPLMAHAHVKGLVPFDAQLYAREPFRLRWQAHGEWLAAPAGEGVPDWEHLLPEILANGYTGAMTVEPFQRADFIRRAVTFIQETAS